MSDKSEQHKEDLDQQTDEEKDIQSFELLPVALDVGFSVAIPLVILALAGRLLDKHFGTGPLLLLLGIFLSVIISSYLVYRKMRDYL